MAQEEEEAAILEKVTVSKTSIKFIASYSEAKTDKIRVTNPSGRVVAFKIKTTRYKLLTSKPVMGMLKSKRGIYVTVKLAKLIDDFTPSNDHVTIMMVVVPADKENMDAKKFWKSPVPECTRRCVIEVSYDPSVEGTPPVADKPPAPPSLKVGAPVKKADESEEESESSE